MTAACSHGMPTPASCVTCMYEGNLAPASPPAPEEAVGCQIVARHDGQCPICDSGIHTGQLIVKTNRDRWVHRLCVGGGIPDYGSGGVW
jgi:hypothetical protein